MSTRRLVAGDFITVRRILGVTPISSSSEQISASEDIFAVA